MEFANRWLTLFLAPALSSQFLVTTPGVTRTGALGTDEDDTEDAAGEATTADEEDDLSAAVNLPLHRALALATRFILLFRGIFFCCEFFDQARFCHGV